MVFVLRSDKRTCGLDIVTRIFITFGMRTCNDPTTHALVVGSYCPHLLIYKEERLQRYIPYYQSRTAIEVFLTPPGLEALHVRMMSKV